MNAFAAVGVGMVDAVNRHIRPGHAPTARSAAATPYRRQPRHPIDDTNPKSSAEGPPKQPFGALLGE